MQAIEGYVFIVTYGRSGSTLVQNLLNAIPGYCIRGENNNALGPLAGAWCNVQSGEVLRNLARNNVQTPPEHPWYGGENIQPAALGRALAQVFLQQILQPPAGTRVAGFKEIRWGSPQANLPVMLNFLATFFPNSRFVFNTRNHDDVARSAWWATMDPAKVKAQLTATEKLFHAYMDAHPARCLHIHYDDYVADHDRLVPLFAFLGEEYDPARVARIMATPLNHLKEGEG